MVVYHCGKQVVRGAYGVEVAGKVQIDVLHRHYLCISAACGTALNSENGAQGRLSQRHHGVFAYTAQTVRKSDGGSSLSLPGGSGGNGGHKYKPSVFAAFVTRQRQINFRLILSVRLKHCFVYPRGGGDLRYGLHFAALRYFNICQMCHIPFTFL